jgi:hypothetical protein
LSISKQCHYFYPDLEFEDGSRRDVPYCGPFCEEHRLCQQSSTANIMQREVYEIRENQ